MARVDEVVDGIYRICSTVQLPDTEFQFNQFLIDDERPALIHTGMHQLYDAVHDDDGARTLEATRRYIRDFDPVVAERPGGAEVVEAMTEKYPKLGNRYTLWLAAYTQPYGD